jgi:hypothetical protein
MMLSLWGSTSDDARRAPEGPRLFKIKLASKHNIPMVDITIQDIEEQALKPGGLLLLLQQKLTELYALAGLELLTPGPHDIQALAAHIAAAL